MEPGTSNAFETMMKAAANLPQYKKVQIHYPVKYNDPKRNDWKMFNNDLIDIMKVKGRGFTTVMSSEKGKNCLMIFVSVPFYLNTKKYQNLLKDRGYLKVTEILKPLMDKVYNYPEEQLHKMQQMSLEDLQKYKDEMARILREPVMMGKGMKETADAASHIINGIRDYLKYLQSINKKMKLIYEPMTPARSKDDGTSSHQETILAGPGTENMLSDIGFCTKSLRKHPCTNQLN